MKKIVFLLFTVFTFYAAQAAAQDTAAVPEQNRIKQILPDFEQYVQKSMKDWQIPGMAIAIVENDKIAYSKGFGVKTAGGNDPVDAHTIFQVGSTTKSFTAALIAMLVDGGKAKWTDKVIDHVPDFRMYDPWVTREFMIQDLLAQHSGMPAYSGDFQSFCGFSRKHIADSVRFIKPVTSFRSEFAYVNNLFLVAAEIIEKNTSKTWEENMQEEIFGPLGMSESSLDAKSLMEGNNVATGHSLENDKVTIVPKDLDWSYIYGPAGGVNSNVVDMSQWLRLQINDGIVGGKRLVSEENTNFMHSPKTIANYDPKKELGTYYCQSWVYEDTRPASIVWHNGGTSGYHSMLAFWPQPKIGIVILTNQSSNMLAEALPKYFIDLYFAKPKRDYSKEALLEFNKEKAEAEAKKPKPPEIATPALALEKYAGVYANNVYENVSVVLKNGALSVVIGPKKLELSLKHWDRDIFTCTLPESGDDSESFVSFYQDEAGSVNRMAIDLLNSDGCGVFEKAEKKQ